MVDEPRDPQSADDDLDSTIDQLELLLEKKRELLDIRPTDRHPPEGVAIPKLTDKIVDIESPEFKGMHIPATPSEGDPHDSSVPSAAISDDVERLVHEKMRGAYDQLKADIVSEIERDVSQSLEATAPLQTTTPFNSSQTISEISREPNPVPDKTTMEKTYDPHAIESKRYEYWENAGYFQPGEVGEPYCIMLPPPNVTGSLHMGHAFQDTLMDALTRYKRMQGKRALWQCGTDHAGIATQMVVERQLARDGISREALGREKFIEAVWDWKAESGGTITKQLRRMGASMDWSRERFTLDAELSYAVTEVFVRLYEEELIYRGKRLVNWDPVLGTAISDLEVVSEEEDGKLWHIRYPLTDGTGHVVVATTRPETMLGDSAVAVHPNDDRYRRIIGKSIQLPLCDRTIPIIADTYVDPEFGSGCVKITPAHDFNDYDVGKRHGLAQINVFTDRAEINDVAPVAYRGLDRYVAREKIIGDLEALNLIARIDAHKLVVPRGDRSQAVIEPYLTDQWFVRIEPLAKPAIAAVENGDIRFIPENWSKTYFEWMRNIDDWCISRQLWWGHRIPAWYDDDGKIYVGHDEADARARGGIDTTVPLRRDDDVLDTWFSSALWPFSTLGWPEKTPELETYYPTSVLVTGFDIIFFWVARMIMMGIKFMGDVPFKEVYIHGLVRDADGNKMSKSKGNILDPLDLIDGIELEPLVTKRTAGLMRPEDAQKIENATRRQFADGIGSFGTDALRFTFASMATQGRDIRFDLGRVGGYRNFCNKIWNAARFSFLMCEGHDLTDNNKVRDLGLAENWIRSRMYAALEQIRSGFESYRFDLASQAIYEFIWDEFCDWYIELAKISLNDPATSEAQKFSIRRTLLETLETSLRALHPLMPFITDEIWLKAAPLLGLDGDSIMQQPFPHSDDFAHDPEAELAFEWIRSFILGIRRIRAENNIEPNRRIKVQVQDGTPKERVWLESYGKYIEQLARTETIERVLSGEGDAASVLAGEMTVFVPLAGLIDPAVEIQRLEKELAQMRKALEVVSGKLNNPSFVEKAPAAVVDKERARVAELQDKIPRTETQLRKFQS
ncbi:MAG: valyl-tRNA synthetase [Gammaproteobacteria bacterium]